MNCHNQSKFPWHSQVESWKSKFKFCFLFSTPSLSKHVFACPQRILLSSSQHTTYLVLLKLLSHHQQDLLGIISVLSRKTTSSSRKIIQARFVPLTARSRLMMPLGAPPSPTFPVSIASAEASPSSEKPWLQRHTSRPPQPRALFVSTTGGPQLPSTTCLCPNQLPP